MAPRYSLKHLQYFVAAGRAGSVTRAAEKLRISQPSVSAAIVHLEQLLGVQLFIRHHAKGLALTRSGKRLLSQAEALLKQANELQNMAHDIAASASGVLDFGCFVTLAPMVVPSLTKDFRKQYPNIRLNCQEADQDGICEALQSGQVDIALTYELDMPDVLEFEALVSYPPYAIVEKNHPMASEEEVSVHALAQEPMVLLDLPHSRQYFESIFRSVHTTPRIEYRARSPELVRSMVANGLGYSILNVPTQTSRALDGKAFKAIRLGESLRPVVMGLLKQRDIRLTLSATCFVEHCRRCLKSPSPGLDDVRSA